MIRMEIITLSMDVFCSAYQIPWKLGRGCQGNIRCSHSMMDMGLNRPLATWLMTIPLVSATILSIHFIYFRPRYKREVWYNDLEYGNVTYHLFRTSERARLEVPLKGFGESFQLPEQNSGILPLIAERIVITPVLPSQLPVFDISLPESSGLSQS